MTYYADEIKDVDGKPFAANTRRPAGRKPLNQKLSNLHLPKVQPETTADQGTGEYSCQSKSCQLAPKMFQKTGVISENKKKALILKFIDVFGTRQALSNNFDLMLKQIEKEKPDEAAKIRDRVKVDEIIDGLLPIYDRNFTSDDLKAFIAFYGSPEGQKLIRTIPELMKESVQES